MSSSAGPPRVVMLSAHYPPHTGGTETHTEEVATRLAAAGWDVRIETSDPTGRLEAHARQGALDVRRHRAWPAKRDWCVAPGMLAAAVSGDADLIHLQGVHTFVAPLVMLGALVAGKPYVVTLHTGGHSSILGTRVRRLQWRILGPLLRRADRLVAVCEWEIELFSQILGVPASHFTLIRNGAELPSRATSAAPAAPPSGDAGSDPVGTSPSGDDEELIVVSLGRLERYKGHQRVIAAMTELLRRRPARLFIVGSGPYEAELRRQVDDAGLSAHVEFTYFPAARRSELGDLLVRADVVTLLSDYEAHPVAVMEALGLGCPVLVADTSGLRELARLGWVQAVDPEAGPDATASAVERCATSTVPAVELPTWDGCAAQVAALYRDVLPRRAAA